jgi:hypothetical protein
MSKAPSPFKTQQWQKPVSDPKQAVALPVDYNSLSHEEVAIVRKRYAQLQEGLCYACGEPLEGPPQEDVFLHRIDWTLFPEGFLTHPIHLHHSHENGLTQGAVHALCNAVLFQVYGE